jgi:hypothetical protein
MMRLLANIIKIPFIQILSLFKKEVSNIAIISVLILAALNFLSGGIVYDKYLLAVVCISSVRNFKDFKLMLSKYSDNKPKINSHQSSSSQLVCHKDKDKRGGVI